MEKLSNEESTRKLKISKLNEIKKEEEDIYANENPWDNKQIST